MTPTLDMQILLQRIAQWGRDRNIIGGATSLQQFTKLVSEVAELGDKGLAKRDIEQIKDGIGDIIVVLCMIAGIEEVSIEECLEAAYNDIKDRRGVLFEGVFVKSTDPQYEFVLTQVQQRRQGAN